MATGSDRLKSNFQEYHLKILERHVQITICYFSQYSFLAYSTEASENSDAAPIMRIPPRFTKCSHAKRALYRPVDINTDGRSENIRIYTCTDSLFEENAIAAVKQWQFSPKIVAGKPILMRDVENKLSFRVTNYDDRLLAEPREIEHTFGNVQKGLLEAIPIFLHPGSREGLKKRGSARSLLRQFFHQPARVILSMLILKIALTHNLKKVPMKL